MHKSNSCELRVFAMSFDEDSIESEKKSVDEITKSLPSHMRNSLKECVFGGVIYVRRLKFLCAKLHEKLLSEEYVCGIHNKCRVLLDSAKGYRLRLEKLSDQDFVGLNVLSKSVSDADELWKGCEFKDKIDRLEEEKEKVSVEIMSDSCIYFGLTWRLFL